MPEAHIRIPWPAWEGRHTTDTPISRKAKVLFLLLLVIALPLGTFVVLEGLGSLVLLSLQSLTVQRPVLAEETSTEYDADIGWVGKKSFAAPDLYGSGVGLRTNARGFRGSEEVSDAVPAGKQRLICSGDSFTLGYGVGDDETWCARLATPGVQTVNMGQGAYGIDQAYLWYKRDGRALAHDVQVLGFITDDFRRMETDRFLNFSKPTLAVRGDSLVVLGVPVPPRTPDSWRARLVPAVRSLRSAQLLASLTNRDRRGGVPQRKGPAGNRKQTGQTETIVAHVVADLARMNAAKGSTLVLAYLPVDTDFRNEASAAWRERMRVIADSLRVPFIDLVPELRKRGREDLQALFIQKTDVGFASAAGHYTVEGNRWVARLLHDRLDSLLRNRPVE